MESFFFLGGRQAETTPLKEEKKKPSKVSGDYRTPRVTEFSVVDFDLVE